MSNNRDRDHLLDLLVSSPENPLDTVWDTIALEIPELIQALQSL
ncbi:MAG: hypothetical protein ACFCBU_04015 [Cyanophyceae cyanobacterium]